ncbi:glycoside hydrolase superfamily [Halteromyces radiatus]|uniref:glycoside hydrolase superfamily n=1 Tax=Halteromyces radiatus TaxID=101107 RepID=UPI00221F830A|nr:glycoside hydrolase superfamily [Halteromyces radiatus]KAI8084647.1 glycoside hydrolase superfamily [Halteromyces radiatus]
MTNKLLLLLLFLFLLPFFCSAQNHMANDGIVSIDKTGFKRYGKTYLIRGANYWYGMNMGSLLGGNRVRLDTELDQLVAMGVNNLRIMAGSEGPDDPQQTFRMQPSLMTSPGIYNEQIFQGLDYLLDAMGKRNMTAIVTLNNFWHWSGGFSQYVAWVTNTVPPYPTRNSDTWGAFTKYTSQFYKDAIISKSCTDLFKAHINTVQERKNVMNGKRYKDDPVIMAWQIANEPQSAPASWYDDLAQFIKKGAPQQLVTSGIESMLDYTDFTNAHSSTAIDYCTCHLWVENWGIYKADDPNGLQRALTYATNYIDTREKWATSIGKPIVLEEFGMARDAWKQPNNIEYKYDPTTTTEHKDIFYNHLFSQVTQMVKQGKAFSGSNFWSYSGIGRPTDPPTSWVGDPPHEPRGWYSVYDQDTTVNVIRKYNEELEKLMDELD